MKMVFPQLLRAWRLICFLLACLFLAPAAFGQASAPAAAYDVRATATAQLLAGITPAPGDPLIDKLAASVVWKSHAAKMQADWAMVLPRLAQMEKWRDQALAIRDPGRKTLIYPFSGPDYLNAAVLFPAYREYVFFSLENPGRLPALAGLSDAQFARLLDDTRLAMRDIFQRNYFITDYMTKQLGTDVFKGTVPVMSIMMALTGKRIVKISQVDLFPDLTAQYADPQSHRPHKRLSGARIDFSDAKTGLAQQLTYFSLDATDQALRFYPDFIDAIGRHKPSTAFLKSASYLLHDHQFKQTRDMLLSTADMIVEDDTGIPYKFFAKSGWRVRLYGQYANPIRSLAYGYQADLRAAYESCTTRPHPDQFPFRLSIQDRQIRPDGGHPDNEPPRTPDAGFPAAQLQPAPWPAPGTLHGWSRRRTGWQRRRAGNIAPQDLSSTSDGVTLSYLETAPAAAGGPLTIVLLPGWCMPASIWQAQLPALGAHYRTLALDPRGQGESEVPDQRLHRAAPGPRPAGIHRRRHARKIRARAAHRLVAGQGAGRAGVRENSRRKAGWPAWR